jgi:Protein of unknown function (DUF3667)
MTSPIDSAATCRNCEAVPIGKFCHECGQKSHITRLTLGYFIRELPHAVFHVDRGFGATLKGLAIRPGETINQYLDGKRARFFNPLTLLVIVAGVSAFLLSAITFNFSHSEIAVASVYAEKYQRFMQLNFRYYTLSLVLYLPLMAAITWLLFLRNRKTYGEHLAINAFVLASTTVITIVFFPILVWSNRAGALLPGFIFLLAILALYQLWAWYCVFQISHQRVSTSLRTVLAWIIYMVLIALIPYAFFLLVYVRRF